MPDHRGQPTEAELRALSSWPHDRSDLLLDEIKRLWCDDDAIRLEGRTLTLFTRGNTSNEDVLKALSQHRVFWVMCWQATFRGGRTEFQLPQNLISQSVIDRHQTLPAPHSPSASAPRGSEATMTSAAALHLLSFAKTRFNMAISLDCNRLNDEAIAATANNFQRMHNIDPAAVADMLKYLLHVGNDRTQASMPSAVSAAPMVKLAAA